jgi:hypothetical protein
MACQIFAYIFGSRQHCETEQIMSAFYLTLLLETALYGALGYVAITAASVEKHSGRDHACKHLRQAGVLYALLAVCNLLHNA